MAARRQQEKPKEEPKPKAANKQHPKLEDTKPSAFRRNLKSDALPFFVGTFAGLGPLLFLLRTRADRERAAAACSPMLKIVPCLQPEKLPECSGEWLREESNASSHSSRLVKMHQNTGLYRMESTQPSECTGQYSAGQTTPRTPRTPRSDWELNVPANTPLYRMQTPESSGCERIQPWPDESRKSRRKNPAGMIAVSKIAKEQQLQDGWWK